MVGFGSILSLPELVIARWFEVFCCSKAFQCQSRGTSRNSETTALSASFFAWCAHWARCGDCFRKVIALLLRFSSLQTTWAWEKLSIKRQTNLETKLRGRTDLKVLVLQLTTADDVEVWVYVQKNWKSSFYCLISSVYCMLRLFCSRWPWSAVELFWDGKSEKKKTHSRATEPGESTGFGSIVLVCDNDRMNAPPQIMKCERYRYGT